MTDIKKIFTSKYENANELSILFKSVPTSSISGGENLDWDEKYFVDNHMWKKQIKAPSAINIKSAGINLIKFFAGQTNTYDKILHDFKVIIFSMKHPSQQSTLFFEEFISSTGDDLTASSTLTINQTATIAANVEKYMPKIDDLSKNDQEQEKNQVLAENITETTTNVENKSPEFDISSVSDKWNAIAKLIIEITDQTSLTSNSQNAIVALGIICLHCFKLMTRQPDSVQNSMSIRLTKQFRDLYRPSEWIIDLIPPSYESLKQLSSIITPSNPDARNILSALIGKLIIENSQISPSQDVKGVLMGSCLTHIGMYGLAPIKHLEQTAIAINKSLSDFCMLICTTAVKSSLTNACALLTLAGTPIKELKIFTKSYNINSQVSWRYARLYNNEHFSRFKTASNSRLILRCMAFMAESGSGNQIERMTILQNKSLNRAIYMNERAFAKKYLKEGEIKRDIPLTEESKTLFHARAFTLQDVSADE